MSTLITDALASGQVVLVVHARTEAETSIAQQIVSQHVDAPAASVCGETGAAAAITL